MILALFAGCGLGAFFFGGLWLTVRRGLSSPRPALWFVGSMLVRIGVVLLAFYWIGGGHFQRLLACGVGFFVGRVAVTWLSRPPAEKPARQPGKVSHASDS
ncbi:MAG: ATP synthase subunit I [Polyangiaceae bacterium]